MFRHTDFMQFDVKPEKPDPVYAHELRSSSAEHTGR